MADITNIHVNDFEGPLDLLLHLIQEKKVDILDLPIAEITSQYLEIIRSWQRFDMEVASEFILTATRLLEIKSRLLLPEAAGTGEEEEDPRQALSRQLIQYSLIRAVGQWLAAREEQSGRALGRDAEYIPALEGDLDPDIRVDQLHRAIRGLLEKKRERTKKVKNVHLVKEEFTVDEKRALILSMARREPEFSFRRLFTEEEPKNIEELSVTFLALLELFKTGQIDFRQEAIHDDIRIFRRTDVCI